MAAVPTIQQKLAVNFSAVLRAWLSPEQMQEVIERNRAETSELVCHSHDFCDANMAMDEAFSDTIERGIYMPSDWEEEGKCTEAQVDADVALWNEAWNIAKASEFSIQLQGEGCAS